MGYASIHLQSNQAREYMSLRLPSSNKGWHKQWIYVKDDTAASLLVFSECLIKEAPEQWGWGILGKDKKRIDDDRAAIAFLK
jgi:hypothetical protein